MGHDLTIAEAARYPRPGMRGPRHLTFRPDCTQVNYLFSAGGTLEQQLWAYEIGSGRTFPLTGPDLGADARPRTRTEELRRERSRTRDTGITEYQYAAEARPPVLLVPAGGLLWVRRDAAPFVALTGSAGAIGPQLSPDGSLVAFVRDDELQVLPTTGGAAQTLTHGGGGGITHGLAEYVAQEEMDRAAGFRWSPDSQQLAYTRVDSRAIPIYPIMHYGGAAVDVEEHAYPFAGAANVGIQLGVIPAGGGETVWMDLGPDPDIYLARVAWTPDGSLTAQIESRDQRTLRLVRFDIATGAATPLIEERGDPWINLGDETRFLKSGAILWASERSGYRHLYLYDAPGEAPRALTAGPWMVTRLVAVDEAAGVVYFEGTRESVLERHLYRVALAGGPITRLTQEPGWHATEVAPECRWFVDQWSNLEQAPQVVLRRLDGEEAAVIYADPEANAADLGLPAPELTTVTTRDGVLLDAAVYHPPAREPGRRYPLIVSVYGGPSAQRVANQWDLTVDLRAQYLAQHGFVVLRVDNRGSANRGLAFEGAIAGHMGRLEVEDQVDVVRALAARPYVDGTRVGIYGWSYGGYMTLMALLRAPDVFQVGVAGAPVVDWAGYDTHYTERYMGHPAANPDGYTQSSPLTHVDQLRGRLLLVHGMVDENVHFRHTARMLAALAHAQKPYDLLLFPDERHMPRDARGLEYQEQRVIGYLQEHLAEHP